MTYAELLSEWFNHHIVEIEESTAYNYKQTLPYVAEALGENDVTEITEQMIYELSLIHI